MANNINIYCDESCHLQHDNCPSMILGAITCPQIYVKEFSKKIKQLKQKHKISANAEVKWTKIAKSKEQFFIDLINLFAETTYVKFRAVKAINKNDLHCEKYNITHDDWYYRMYYILLIYIIDYKDDNFFAYIDIKDTKSSFKRTMLRKCIANSYTKGTEEAKKIDDRIKNIQAIRSDESQLLQLADILIGAVGYEERISKIISTKPSFTPSEPKLLICKHIKKVFKLNSFEEKNNQYKFNLFIWSPNFKRDCDA